MTAIRWQPEWRWIGAVAALLVFAAGCGLGGKPGTDAGPVDDADATSGGGRWEPISTAGAPSPRIWHTAVWTGEGMIVWGGNDTAPGRLDTGGRYDPVTDTWSPTSLDGAPAPRTGHGAVWTGSEMIVWGGWDGFSLYSDGARYDPLTDTWTPMSDTGAPEPRGVGDRAVWTGDDLIVWGGATSSAPGSGLDTGGRYDPSTDTWTPTATAGAPDARTGHTAVWTGSEMIVWGGLGNEPGGVSGEEYELGSGGRYDPASDTWAGMDQPALSERASHTAVWTGSEMMVWGGADCCGFVDTGGRYDPASDTWAYTAVPPFPSARVGHAAVWTGSEMIVWGGTTYSFSAIVAARYAPASDTWLEVSPSDPPERRSGHTAVWTGAEMIVWGGGTTGGEYLNTGVRYLP